MVALQLLKQSQKDGTSEDEWKDIVGKIQVKLIDVFGVEESEYKIYLTTIAG